MTRPPRPQRAEDGVNLPMWDASRVAIVRRWRDAAKREIYGRSPDVEFAALMTDPIGHRLALLGLIDDLSDLIDDGSQSEDDRKRWRSQRRRARSRAEALGSLASEEAARRVAVAAATPDAPVSRRSQKIGLLGAEVSRLRAAIHAHREGTGVPSPVDRALWGVADGGPWEFPEVLNQTA